jgi:FdhD protein
LAFSYRPDQRVAAVRVADAAHRPARNLIVTNSCGLCGSRNIDQLLSDESVVPDGLRVRPSTLRQAVETMRKRQAIFARTGGTHAAAIFDTNGQIISFGEDIGRHNAVDKAIGRCLLDELPLRSCGLALSGRVSLELVGKAARAGIELVAAVSAPSSLAILASQRCGVTLCGFVREQRATVYTHPHRIVGLRPDEQAGSGGPGPR